jgi:DNA-binding FadR family transcriptional regulator
MRDDLRMGGFEARGLHGKLVQELGLAIAGGHMAEGERLDVDALRARYDVSLTVVRDALRVLATKGLIDARPRRGTCVRGREHWSVLDTDVIGWMYSDRPDERFLRNLEEARRAIEPACARLAATRRTAEDLTHLRIALAQMADGDDIETSIGGDVCFHHAVANATHNEIFQHLASIIDAGLRARDRHLLSTDPAPTMLIAAHTAVADAIEAGDPDAAERAMLTLLARGAADLAALPERQRLSPASPRAPAQRTGRRRRSGAARSASPPA